MRNRRRSDAGLYAAAVVWAVTAMAAIALWAAVIYIALHFIGKAW